MAAETGNSAAPPGALIPVLTLGIPGSAPAAVLLAAMILHGVRPGPMIMIESPDFVYQVVVMLLFASVAIFVLGILLTPLLLKILAVRRERLMPVVFVLCVIGSYAIQQRMFDVWVMVIFGLLGFLLRQMRYPMAPLVLGIVLGDIFDKSLRRSWVIHDGDFSFYFSRPISVLLMVMCAFTLLMSFAPTRDYLAPKLQRIVRALFGGLLEILMVHGRLLRWFTRAARALAGRPFADQAGPRGFWQCIRLGGGDYARTIGERFAELVRALLSFVFSPVSDLLRLLRLMPGKEP